MPVTPTYPGVYIEEIPSGVRTITGVATSITAFIGYTAQGPVDKAVQVFNFGDFERNFGGLAAGSDVSYAVQQYFQNGGGEAWIVRVAKDAASAGITLLNNVTAGVAILEAKAMSQGAWGNNLRMDVDYDTSNPASLFNLTVTEFVEQGGVLQAARSEIHRNLSLNSLSPNYAVEAVNATSSLIRLTRPATALAPINAVAGESLSGDLTLADINQLGDDRRRLAVTVNGDGPYEFDIFDAGGSISGATLPDKLTDLAKRIEDKVKAIKPAAEAFSQFTVAPDGGIRLLAKSGEEGENSSVRFTNAGIRNAATVLKLGLNNGGVETEAVARIRPVRTGTVSGNLTGLNFAGLPNTAEMNVSILTGAATEGPFLLPLWGTAADKPDTLEKLRLRIANALGASPKAELNKARVMLNQNRLQITSGGTNPNARLAFTNGAAGAVADALRLTGVNVTENVARYALGVGITSQAQSAPIAGSDGQPPDANGLKGNRLAKKGLYALEDVDLFNILCLPNVTENAVLGEALAYAKERRAFLLIDMPGTVDTVEEAKQWLSSNTSLRDKNAAVYFPRILSADPLQNFRLRPFAPSGAVAGVFARTDTERGVWKAAAGTDAIVRGAQGLAYTLTDQENGALNPLGVNCLRTFPVFGTVIWGARTREGADQLASEWKYVPVRRLALFLEESLYRGTQWVVFEPNDEPLWAQIRLNVGAFMQNLFRQGAFQGKTPREAYFVKCDKETTTQNDINLGIVNIVVGFAPLKPAEFVIIKLQQMAGQIAV